jgi:hypothetical protein
MSENQNLWPTAETAGQLPAEALDEQLAHAMAELKLDPGLAAAYSSATTALYTFGDSSPDFSTLLLTDRLGNLQTLRDSYHEVYRDRLTTDTARGGSRVVRRAQESTRYDSVGQFLDELQASPDGKQWINDTLSRELWGITRSSVLHDIELANQVTYCLDVPLEEDPRIAAFGLSAEQLLKAVTYPGEDSAEITRSETARRLREQGVVDLSKEHLDARVDNFAAVVQVEAARFFLRDLHNLSLFGGTARRAALTLAAKHLNHLLSDDFESKIAMNEDVAAAFNRSATLTREPRSKRLLTALSGRARTTAAGLTEDLEGFIPVYEALGYELPPILQPTTDVDDTAITEVQQRVSPPQQEGARSEQDQPLVGEIDEQMQVLLERAERFSSNWRLTARQRRERSFGALQRELVMGFNDLAGSPLLASLEKEDAKRFVDILARLYDIAQFDDPTVAKQTLADAAMEQGAIMEDFKLIKMVAQEVGIGVIQPSVAPVREVVDTLGSNWPAYRQLILRTWPHFEGVEAVRRIERLLFDTAQAAENEPSLQETIAIQEDVAQQLDKIILPPGATQQDLERELQRVGAEQTTVTRIEWQRLRDLIEIRDQFDGVLFRSKEKSLGGAPPYFVVVISFGGDTIAIAESPVFGNATYVVSEKHAPGTWLEVLELSKRDARAVGAHRVIHKSGQGSASHLDKIYDKMLELNALREQD